MGYGLMPLQTAGRSTVTYTKSAAYAVEVIRRTGVARIAGVNIPDNKHAAISLTYIFGIGRTRAKDICAKLSIPDARRVHQLTDDEVLKMRPKN